MSKMVVIFKRFERFWHWAQALLIFSLILTGLEIHGFIDVFGFGQAVSIHNKMGFIWAVLLVLIYAWIFISGDWKQWLPIFTFKGLLKTARFYGYGVFLGENHPHHMTPDNKFNPLQKLAYIGIVFGILPLQVISGLAFYFFPELKEMGYLDRIDLVAYLHTLIAYILFAFIFVHIYMTTFGKTIATHLKAMITGKEEVDDDH